MHRLVERLVSAFVASSSLLAACGGGGGGSGGVGGGPISPSPVFVHLAGGGSDFTVVRNTLLDGLRDARPIVTQLVNPDGSPAVVLNPHPIGVLYDDASGFWRIRNLDGADLPEDAAFFISILAPGYPGVFVHTATDANRSSNVTRIDHPITDGAPTLNLFVTQWINGEGVSVIDGSEIGVYYQSGTWRIFDQDLGTMPLGADFIVAVAGAGPSVFRHAATAANVGGAFDQLTTIAHPSLDGNPSALFHVTQNWDPDGIYNAHPVGIGYSGFTSQWYIANLDDAPMPVGASFNIVIE